MRKRKRATTDKADARGTGDARQRTGGVTFTIDRSGIRTNSDGSITVPAQLTRTGVAEYQREDGSVREARVDAEVFREESLATLEGAPVTRDHPPDFITLDNLSEFQIGAVTNFTPNPPYVDGRLRIWNQDAIDSVRRGFLTEVSSGYVCEPKATTDGDDVDVIQTSIVYNHVAIGPTDWSRWGTQLRLDSKDNEVLPHFPTQEVSMDEFKEALEPVMEALGELKERMDALEKEPEETPEPSPIVKPETLPPEEQIQAMVTERVDSLLKLELEARDAYQAFFPEDYVEPKLCGRTLCEAVLQTVDSDREIEDDADLGALVREAQLLAKKERQDARKQETTLDSLQAQLTGAVKAKHLDSRVSDNLPAALQ